MKLLASLAATILVPLVLSACVSVVLSRTLLHADYLSRGLKSAEVYPKLTAATSTLIAQQSLEAIKPATITELIHKHFPEQTFQTRASAWLSGMELHIKQGAPAPVFALPELSSVAQEFGLDPSSNKIPQSFSLPIETDQKLTQTYQKVEQVQQWLYVLTGGLFLLLFLISVAKRSYGNLVYLFMVSALLQASLFAAFRYAPNYVVAFIPKGDAILQPIVDSFISIVYKVLQDISIQFAVIAAVFFVVGVIVWGLSLVSGARQKSEKHVAKVASKQRTPAQPVTF